MIALAGVAAMPGAVAVAGVAAIPTSCEREPDGNVCVITASLTGGTIHYVVFPAISPLTTELLSAATYTQNADYVELNDQTDIFVGLTNVVCFYLEENVVSEVIVPECIAPV